MFRSYIINPAAGFETRRCATVNVFIYRRVEQIEASRAPQILTVDHNDAAAELSEITDDDCESSDDDVDIQSEALSQFDNLSPQSMLPAITSGTFMTYSRQHCMSFRRLNMI